MDKSLYIFYLFVFFISAAYGDNCRKEPKCKISSVYGMKGADCYDKKMRKIPQCLPSDVQVIYLASNKIRKLAKDELKRYSYLKMLYLSDNSIGPISEGVFDDLDSLDTLDLSLNSITELPPVIFHLPSLMSLYLGQNWNININDAIEKIKPISSPLVQLDISSITNEEPDFFPNLELLPFLVTLNISNNQYLDMTPRHFAGLCSLVTLDNTNVSVDFQEQCDCWKINTWLQRRKVKFTPFQCEIDITRCNEEITDDDLDMLKKCKKRIETVKEKSRLMKILIPVGIGAVLLIAIGLYLYIKKRKQRRLQSNNKKDPPIPDGQILLNNQSTKNFQNK